MADAQGFLGNPGVGFLSMLVNRSACRMGRGEGDPIRSQHLHQYPGRHCRSIRGRGARRRPEHSGVRVRAYPRGGRSSVQS
jgi:hypothetical protein